MTAQQLIAIFEDTKKIILESEELTKLTKQCQAKSKLYFDKYFSPLRTQKGICKAEVLEDTTFSCASNSMADGGKVAVLNFANPHEPGGGVLRGAMAQEECLCRSSNLYYALNQLYFRRHFYSYHYKECDMTFSDRIIYSPDVAVIKSDDITPQPLENPFFVDVITCAAPCIDLYSELKSSELVPVYESRIRNILEVAMANDVDTLILGAWGCGAFRNDPEYMSEAFYNLLIKEGYAKYFKSVKFAIKKSERQNDNFKVFFERIN